jgi:hypothetical protein
MASLGGLGYLNYGREDLPGGLYNASFFSRYSMKSFILLRAKA